MQQLCALPSLCSCNIHPTTSTALAAKPPVLAVLNIVPAELAEWLRAQCVVVLRTSCGWGHGLDEFTWGSQVNDGHHVGHCDPHDDSERLPQKGPRQTKTYIVSIKTELKAMFSRVRQALQRGKRTGVDGCRQMGEERQIERDRQM